MTTTDENTLPEFADGPPMPEMCEAILADEDVERLFEDLAACTRVVSIQEKGSRQAYAGQRPATLHSAKARVLNRNVRAVQIRYTYQERDWIDTLICLPAGIQLIRCQQ